MRTLILAGLTLCCISCGPSQVAKHEPQAAPARPEQPKEPINVLTESETKALIDELTLVLPFATYEGHLDDGSPCEVVVQTLSDGPLGVRVTMTITNSEPTSTTTLSLSAITGQSAKVYAGTMDNRYSLEIVSLNDGAAGSDEDVSSSVGLISVKSKADRSVSSIYVFDSQKTGSELASALCRLD